MYALVHSRDLHLMLCFFRKDTYAWQPKAIVATIRLEKLGHDQHQDMTSDKPFW